MSAALAALHTVRRNPVVASGLRYAVVVGLCLTVCGASGSFLGNAALGHLNSAEARATAPARPMVEISVPDTPVIAAVAVSMAPSPGPALAADATTTQLAAPPPAVNAPAAAARFETVALTPEPAAGASLAPAAEILYVRRAVNVRAAPSNGSARLGVLPANQQVEVAERRDGWVRVAVSSVVMGWVYGDFLGSGR